MRKLWITCVWWEAVRSNPARLTWLFIGLFHNVNMKVEPKLTSYMSATPCNTRQHNENYRVSVSLYAFSLTHLRVRINRPRSIYQYSNIDPKLWGQNCNFLKFPLSFNSQKRLGYKENTTKHRSLSWKPWSHVRILIYWMWPITFMSIMPKESCRPRSPRPRLEPGRPNSLDVTRKCWVMSPDEISCLLIRRELKYKLIANR